MHDLACFMEHFHFLLGVVIVKKYINMGNEVLNDLVRKFFDSRFFIIGDLLCLCFKFIHAGSSGTTCTLVGRNTHTLYMREFFDRFQGYHHLNGCTIWIGNDTPGHIFCVLGIYFRYDKRNIIFHSESTGIIYHDCSVFGNSVSEFLGNSCSSRNQGNINSPEIIIVLQFFNSKFFAFKFIG